MTTRSYLTTKAPARAKTAVPTNAIQTRAFEPQAESSDAAEADTKTQLDHAEHVGHDLTTAPPIQAKLTIGAPNDPYEQEADRVASRVVEQINAPQAQQPGTVQREVVDSEDEKKVQAKPVISQLQREAIPEEEDKELQTKALIQRQEMPEEEEELQMKPAIQRQEMPEEEEELQMKLAIQRQEMPEEEELQMKPAIQRQEMPEEEELQMKPAIQRQEMPEEEEELQAKSLVQRRTDGGGVASTNLESSINAARGKGQPLNDGVRSSMEKAFGTDFGGVRVHADAQSDQLNRSVQARAFTTGQDIFFRQGEYQPEHRRGQELLAHELTHVVQQNAALQRKMPHAQRKHNAIAHPTQPIIQRNPLAGAVAWATIGSAGFAVAQGTLTQGSSDLTYSFDEMNGTKLCGNDESYKTKHKYPIIEDEKEITVWVGTESMRKLGLKFALNYLHDGYSLGNISMRLLDTYDWVGWGGSVRVNITPLDLPGPAQARITCNVAASRTIGSSISGSAVFNLSATNKLNLKRASKIWHEHTS